MPIPQTAPFQNEKPSTSETAETTGGQSLSEPQSSVSAADVSSQTSSMGETAGGKIGEGKGSAEEAAERLYEERIEEEYAKREGGA